MAESDAFDLTGFVIGGLVGSLVVAILFLYPLWRSLKRAGFHPAWSLIVLIPYSWFATVPAIYGILAFGRWPAIDGPPPKTGWRLFGRTRWVPVSAEEAAANRYYGVDGWLLATFSVTATAAVMNLINLFNPKTMNAVANLYGLTSDTATALSGMGILLCVAYLVLIPIRRPAVPFVIIGIGWAYSLIYAAIITGSGTMTPAVTWWIVGSLAYCAAFSAYWLKSRRVNVTYRRRIPATAAITTGTAS